MFLPRTISDLTDTGLGGRDGIDPYVGFYFDAEVGFIEFVLMVARSVLLAVIENKRPDLGQWFFEVDLAPPILWFLCRRTGGCCGELMDLNVDCNFCTVHLWFASIPPLLLSVTMMVDATVWSRKYEPAQKGKNIFIFIKISWSILACVTISLFLICGLRVFYKRGYDREYTSLTAEMMTVKLSVLTAW
jgi:hypothetical protein